MKAHKKEDRFWTELKAEVDKLLLSLKEVEQGKMFGYPAYYVNGKLAMCHFGEGLAIKLPEEGIKSLNQTSLTVEAFCPMGRKMGKNWVIILPEEATAIWNVQDILLQSVYYLKELTQK